MKRTVIYNIDEKNAGMAIKDFLSFREYSSQNLTDLKKAQDGIIHNGERAYVTEKLEAGDSLVINITDDHSSEKIPPVRMELDIVYEDEDLIIISKPADMPTHPSMNNYENTLANGLAYYFESKGEDFVFRSINRLDRNTTGLVLVAKNAVSGAILSKQVREGRIKKEYVAIAQGIIDFSGDGSGKGLLSSDCSISVKGLISGNYRNVEGLIKGADEDHFTIDAPIARVEGSTIERKVDESGERAVTHVTVLERRDDMTLVSCDLETGRTHQIRVHMAHIGHPLIGDGMYNPDNKDMKRQALHCRRLAFTQPLTGEKVDVTVPLAGDMEEVLRKK